MIYVIIILVAILLIYVLSIYNSFVKLNNKVKEAFSTMDVYLKQRWDLIPNIVEVTKGYASHEKETLENVINLRNHIYDRMSDEEKMKNSKELNTNITRLMALAESYPELKASDNFKKLSENLTQVENDIANSRKYYNGVIKLYNNKVEMFPSNIMAKILKYKTKNMFEIKEEEKENVKVDL